MQSMIDSNDVQEFLGVMMPELDEKQRRHMLAALSEIMGRGSVTELAGMTGISTTTIAKGKHEIKNVLRDPRARPSPSKQGRVRAPGAGRKPAQEAQPGIDIALESLLDGNVVGDPESPLTWTTLSTRSLANALRLKGFSVSHVTVSRMLEDRGYSLQQNKKYIESGDSSLDRDGQFRYIFQQSALFMMFGYPVVSVDAKKLVGNYKNDGLEYWPKGESKLVNDHSFMEPLGKAVPYGIYNINRDESYVSVGVSSDTAEFAVNSIRSWWATMGRETYPEATMLMITVDCDGSNSRRNRLWKCELQRFADETGLTVAVRHFPPGTSKWNKIEHRLFSFISMNWHGKPLTSYEIIVNLIGNTTNSSELKVRCELDLREYAKGIKVLDEEMNFLNIKADG